MSAFSQERVNVFKGWDRFDYLIPLSAIALVVFGLILIHSGSSRLYEGSMLNFSNPVTKQAIFAIFGLMMMLVFARLDYHLLTHYSWLFYIIGILSLLAVMAIGNTAFGSTRWINVGPIQIQPSEFAKLAVILMLANYFANHGGDARELRTLLISLAIVFPCFALVFIQPDLGTSIVFLVTWLGVVLIAGVSRKHLLVMGAAGLALAPFIFAFAVADYQIERIDILLDPNADPLGAGYNVRQSQYAVGSGGLTGKGFMEGEQTQLNFLKVPTKDFIFSVLGEEFGFAGAMVMFGLFILLLWRGIRAAQLAGDVAGQLVAAGIVLLILMQTFINIAVNVSLFPVTGIPLPLVSQGGSSLVSIFMCLGILESIIMRHRAYRQF
jgi:rod shape determining protein RodA